MHYRDSIETDTYRYIERMQKATIQYNICMTNKSYARIYFCIQIYSSIPWELLVKLKSIRTNSLPTEGHEAFTKILKFWKNKSWQFFWKEISHLLRIISVFLKRQKPLQNIIKSSKGTTTSKNVKNMKIERRRARKRGKGFLLPFEKLLRFT